MDPNRAGIAGYQETSLTSMKIPFLLNHDPGEQETPGPARVVDPRNYTDTFEQQRDTSTMAPQSLHSRVPLDRVQSWVVSQSSTHVAGPCPSYAADSEDSVTSSGEQWSQTYSNVQAPVGRVETETTPPDHGYSRTNRIVPTNTELIQPAAFAFQTSEHCRSPRLGYTRDEKLFIMHARVIGNMSWQNISMIFEKMFGRKDTKYTIPGLRSVYYRTRGDWGMDYVTRNGPSQRQKDKIAVTMKLNEHAGGFCNPRVVL
jgi:hypothetical protein